MTDEEAHAYLEKEIKLVTGDTEAVHLTADDVLCVVLEQAGYPKLVAAWQKVDKWYA